MKIRQGRHREHRLINSHAAARAAVSELTPVQVMILAGLANGESSNSLAALLEMDVSAFGTHANAVLCALNAGSTADAVRIALLAGLGEHPYRPNPLKPLGA